MNFNGNHLAHVNELSRRLVSAVAVAATAVAFIVKNFLTFLRARSMDKEKILKIFLEVCKKLIFKNWHGESVNFCNFFLDKLDSFQNDEEFLDIVEIMFSSKRFRLSISPYECPMVETSFMNRYKIYRPLDRMIYIFLQSKGMIALYNIYQKQITYEILRKLDGVVSVLEIVHSTLQHNDVNNFFERDITETCDIIVKNLNSLYSILMDSYVTEENFDDFRKKCITFVNDTLEDIKRHLFRRRFEPPRKRKKHI